jgi:hypothetical protein
MTPQQWFVFGALACASFVVHAQPAQARPNPVDANATVPLVSYRSAFDTYQRASSEEQPSPDKVWRQANEEVAKSGAHSGHAMPPQSSPVPPAAPKAPPTDHSKHH